MMTEHNGEWIPDVGKLVATLAGLHMSSPEASEIMAQLDWSQVWPRVDGRGWLTGDVLDSNSNCILVAWDGRKLTTNHGHTGSAVAAILRRDAPARLMCFYWVKTGE